ncbi:MAG: anaerobic ribonucleoside-triphosphate reductase activating protein [Oscillospiraceae bacterium]|jgi:pyruvate formate lyase activating enzyme|nr:anaerobic ribonucleoside-triphosphate reductase activating protein [Oscillospiraceae bacterium]
MIFSGIQKSSLVDYPGLVSCVLFVPGCNFDCFFCHNRSLFSGPHEILDPNAVWAFLKKRAGLLDAVVLTGGEPTLQSDLVETLQKFKSLGYQVKLDTNGSSPEAVSAVLKSGVCSYYAIDYKAPAARYHEICGPHADAKSVQTTIKMLLDSDVSFEIRTTVIPQLTEKDLLQMASELPPVPRWSLNRYRKPEQFKPCDTARINAPAWTQEQIDGFAEHMTTIQPYMNRNK